MAAVIGASAGGQFVSIPIFNQLVPKDNPKAIAMLMDFTAGAVAEVDFLQSLWQNQITMIQGCYYNTRALGCDVDLYIPTVPQSMKFSANMQGYRPLLMPDGTPKGVFTPSGNSAANKQFQIIFLNVPMPAYEWSAT